MRPTSRVRGWASRATSVAKPPKTPTTNPITAATAAQLFVADR